MRDLNAKTPLGKIIPRRQAIEYIRFLLGDEIADEFVKIVPETKKLLRSNEIKIALLVIIGSDDELQRELRVSNVPNAITTFWSRTASHD